MAGRTRRILDYADRTVRLTDERLRHIQEHPEMVGQECRIREVLQKPDVVLTSQKDSSILPPLCARPGWVKATDGSRQNFRTRCLRERRGSKYGQKSSAVKS